MSGINIETGIPLPRKGSGRPSKYPWRQMNVGDSFVVPKDKRVYGFATNAKRAGIRIAVRTEGDTVRVWRIE